ncbi:type I restriction enzyme S subunit [Flavobacterium sp. CG_9.1]|uniref:restriction endonuclease subunit S n=1 Tax=Flavobacterium sp. CG_9.1 TaxID=2787728 RepID=UPI0018CBBAF9|nr:restriction endonuclease subunit S [Flavobacterium sp. CG_9.1]MBG6062888.1 type I restriction enzyme S subunit [Flavobacterium sp. CG_9.1]
MKLNYNRLGDYITKVEKRNKDSRITDLRGLSMTKEFRQSTSNIVGTDMSVYKVMLKWQFACDFMSVIRVHKFPVVLKIDDEPNLVSPAYPVFEVKNLEQLNPEYLMMWFRRSEFDRYADFKCDSAIRGGFDWDALCDCMLPIPSLKKQLEIVNEYKTIQNRIKLNNQLIIKLEETAQAIYKQWFIDFEFPDENGKPYKSTGGAMVWCEELDKEIPINFETITLKELIDYKKGNPFKSLEYEKSGIPIIRVSDLSKKSIDLSKCHYLSEKNSFKYLDFAILTNDIIITSVGSWPQNPESVVGKVVKAPAIKQIGFINQNMIRIRAKKSTLQLLLYTSLSTKEFSDFVIIGAQGSANQASVTIQHLFSFTLCFPKESFPKENLLHFNKIYDLMGLYEVENLRLIELKDLLLTKMTKVKTETHILN